MDFIGVSGYVSHFPWHPVPLSFRGWRIRCIWIQFEKIQVYDLRLPGFLCESQKAEEVGRTAGIDGKIGSGLYHGVQLGA